MQLAASLEAGSEHPIALAITESAKQQELEFLPLSEFHSCTGMGVKGQVAQQQLHFGNEKLMTAVGIDTSTVQSKVMQLAQKTKTPMYLAIDNQLAAVIAVADPIKSDAKQAIDALRAKHIQTVMLTGDNLATAQVVAQQLGVDKVIAEVLPSEKAQAVIELQQQGQKVAMVGDGINDAPALAQADVGIAIGSGTDVAIESADVTLMGESLISIVNTIAVSQASIGNIKQNLFGAFIYNTAGVPIAAGILYPFVGVLLSPVIAGAAMALSSLTVVSNANRLRLFKLNQGA